MEPSDGPLAISQPAVVDVGDLSELLPDWRRHLRAANRAASTVRRYEKDARAFFAFLNSTGMPTRADAITREHLEHFLADEQSLPRRRRRGEAATLSPATVAGTYRSLQQLWRWLVDEGEVTTNPFDRMKPPHVPEQPVPVITDKQLTTLLAACKGAEFNDRRDTALIRLLIDTGIRSSELLGLTVDDLDFDQDVAHVRGKGGRRRAAPFGNRTGEALRRYLRARGRHSRADLPALWIGSQGPLGQAGLRQILNRPAEVAGIGHVHPHQFRHTMAHRWLANGQQEQDLMRIAGWRSREMVGRYAASAIEAGSVKTRPVALAWLDVLCADQGAVTGIYRAATSVNHELSPTARKKGHPMSDVRRPSTVGSLVWLLGRVKLWPIVAPTLLVYGLAIYTQKQWVADNRERARSAWAEAEYTPQPPMRPYPTWPDDVIYPCLLVLAACLVMWILPPVYRRCGEAYEKHGVWWLFRG